MSFTGLAGRRGVERQTVPGGTRREIAARMASLPLTFEVNQGQTDQQVRFLSRGPGYTLFLTPQESVLTLESPASRKPQARAELARPEAPLPGPQAVVRTRLLGANPHPAMVGLEKRRCQVSYFHGDDPKQWRVGVPTYGRARYAGVYRGIDLVYYGENQQLEYDFVVQPGADPGAIRLQIEGPDRAELDSEGDLVLHAGERELRQNHPICYQETANGRVPVEGSFALAADSPGATRVAFRLGAYDRSRPLVIDPVLNYSTYLGGTSSVGIYSVAVDANGIAYVAGQANNASFPARNGYPVPTPWLPSLDAFVSKLDTRASGADALLYSTTIGSAAHDWAYGVAIDGAGSAYLTGETWGSASDRHFPVVGGFQGYQGGPFPGSSEGDAFLARIDTTLTGAASLVYSTVVSAVGTGTFGQGIAVDSGGRAWITGEATGATLPLVHAYGGDQPDNDAFIAEVDPSLSGPSSLLYCTYLGGSGKETARGIALDAAGYVYIDGETTSSDFPLVNAYQTYSAGKDAFLAKLDPSVDGTAALLYSTYLGGSGDDFAYGVAVESTGLVYAAGQTNSTDLPTRNGVMGDPGDANYDGFAAEFDTTAVGSASLLYSTYLGGSARDGALAVAANGTGSAFVGGYAYSSDFPVSPGAYQTIKTAPSNANTAFLTELAPVLHPAAPARLTAAAISPTRVNVTWTDYATNEDGFRLERSSDGGATWPDSMEAGPATATGSAVTYNDTGLNAATTYTYRVRSHTATLDSAYAGPASARTQDGPAAPSALAAAAVSTTRLQVTWTDNASTEQGFKLERSTDGGTTWPFVMNVASLSGTGATATFNDSGLTPGTSYTYRVRAYNDGAYSDYAGPVTTPTQDAPAAPGDLAAAGVSTTSVKVTWTDNATNEQGFRLERSADGGSTWPAAFVIGARAGSGVAVTYTNTGLTPGTAYSYRLRAYNDTTYSSFAGPVTATTEEAPAAPTSLAAAPLSTTSIQVTWTDNAANEQGFKLERSTDSGATWPLVLGVPPRAGTGQVTYANSGLAAGTTYTYRVRAYNDAVFSAYEGPASAATLDRPAGPSSLGASDATSSSIKLTWTDNASNEQGFRLERSADGGSTWPAAFVLGARPGTGAVLSYTNTGLAPGTTYAYRVAAYSGAVFSDYAGPVNGATQSPPAAPSDLTATAVSSSSIKVSWTDNADNEGGFRLERSVDGGSTWPVAIVAAARSGTGALVSYANTGLTPGAAYSYRVLAFNGTVYSPYAGPVSATTQEPPAAPSGLSAAVLSTTRIKLTWTDNAANEQGFRLERSVDGGATWPTVFTVAPVSGSGGTAAYTDASVSPATSYAYRVRAYSDGVYSAYEGPVSATTQDAPAAPGDLTATAASGTSIKLTWTDNATNEQGFRLERSTEDGVTWTVAIVVAARPGTGAVVSYTNNGLTTGTTYTYRVRAYNDAVYSAPAGPVSATP